MGHRCCSKQKVKRGLWSPEEDEKLITHVTTHGHGSWSSIPKLAGLQRCGKSCRLRWINYLRPDLKRGSFTAEEEQIIIDIHRILGNRWAQIAKHLPGRTDNEVKNFWNSCIKKKLISQGLDPKTHNLIPSHKRASNNLTSNRITQIHQHHRQQQQPFSIFTLNSQNRDASMEITNNYTPVLTLPAPPPPLDDHQSMAITCEYQNPTALVWSTTDLTAGTGQDSHDSNIFPCVSSIESMPISSSVNNIPSGFGVLDDNHNCIWSANAIVDQHLEEAPTLMEHHVPSHDQQDKEINRIDEAKGSAQDNMDISFDSSSFDLEYVESSLMSVEMCRDLSSMDNFAWNF